MTDVPWAMQVVVRVEKNPAPGHTAVLRAAGSAVAASVHAFDRVATVEIRADQRIVQRRRRWLVVAY